MRRWESCTIRHFTRVVMANMKVAQQIVETLLEGDEKPKKSMPPWLQKKISGKSDDDDDDGDDDSEEKKDDEAEKSNVSNVTGSKKSDDGDKVEHTF